MRSRRWTLAAVTAVALGLTLTDSAAPPAVAATDDVRLRFDTTARSALSSHAVTGSTGASATTVVSAGGQVVASPSRSGQGSAADFPPARKGSGAPAAVVAVRAPSGTDALSPRSATFAFGADFRLDTGSTGVDGGDNLIQRGLADDAGQYKLEIDGQRPACVVKGSRGTVTARSPHQISRGVWYSVQCRRSGDAVQLTVQRIGGSATTTTARGATGVVATRRADTPLSVGGKLTPAGKIATWSSDQFNGLVDNAFLVID